MELLEHTSHRRTKLVVLLFLGTFVGGCAMVNWFGATPAFGFSHRIHAKEGLECVDCHAAWNSADNPGMPARGGCMLCHENIDANKPPERHIGVLFEGDVYKVGHGKLLADEILFSHQRHATKPIDCQACHVGAAESDHLAASSAAGMTDCTACHREQNVANECATCHKRLRIDVAPDSHAFQWKKLHGPTVRAHDTATANNCALCHQDEKDCRTCHQSEPPDNHDNYFRLRGHGLHARMDRQNCAACHRSDSCDACHRDTRPINHVGSFGGTFSNHCISCHLPLQNNECFTCHKDTPSHALAPPKPPTPVHAPGMNCRQCHGLSQPLPHADNGADCNDCHR
jgi:hypothetical protein